MSDILQAKTITGEYSGFADSALRDVSSTFLTAVPEGYATEDWVTAQGYLTAHQDLSDYQTTAGMTAYQPAGAYLTSVPDTYLQNTDLTIADNKVTAISGVPLAGGGGNITTANTGYDYKIGIEGVDVYGTMTAVSSEPIYRFDDAIAGGAFVSYRRDLHNNEFGIDEVNTHYYSISACDSIAFIITNIGYSFGATKEVEFTPVFSALCLNNDVSLTVPLNKMYFSQTALPGVTGPYSAVSAKINIPSEWGSDRENMIRYNIFLSSWSSHGSEYDIDVLYNCDIGYGFGSAQLVDAQVVSGIFIPNKSDFVPISAFNDLKQSYDALSSLFSTYSGQWLLPNTGV